MKITIQKQEAARALAACLSASQRSSTLPILTCSLIVADGASVRFAATDLMLSVATTVEANVGESGSVAVNTRALLERVKAMNCDEFTISSDSSNHVTIKGKGARKYTLHGIDGEEFPSIDTPPDDGIVAPSSLISSAIADVAYAASDDDTRANLNGALVEIANGKIVSAATDGHRLSRSSRDIDTDAKLSMLLPLRGLNELRKACDAAGGDVTLAVVMNTLFASFGGTAMSLKLVDAQFPPIDQVIPSRSDTPFSVVREDLIDAIRAVGISAAQSKVSAGMRLEVDKSKVKLSGESAETGAGYDEVKIEDGGKSRSVGINPKFMIDAMTAIASTRVIIDVPGELEPIVIRPDDETSFVAVIMPMRI